MDDFPRLPSAYVSARLLTTGSGRQRKRYEVRQAMQHPVEIATLASVMDDLTKRGFPEHFILVNGRLRAVNSGKTFPADQVVISEYHRFEGVSDPDDMSILYAIETLSGIRGTLADAFGVYSDPLVGDFMKAVALRRPLQP